MKYKKIISLLKGIYNVCFPHLRLKSYNKYTLSKADLQENDKTIYNSLAEIKSTDSKIKSCVWFLPLFGNIHAGGAITIFKIAQQLSINNGCFNYFVFERKIAGEWSKIISESYPYLKFEFIILDIDNKHFFDELPVCDAGICTFWSTSLLLVKYNNCRKKFYLLQDDERLFYSSGSYSSLVEATYSFGFFGITNSTAIKESYARRCKVDVHNYIPGINTELLNIPDYKINNGPLKIVAYGRPSHARNAFEILANVLSSLADELSDIEIIFVGEDFDAKGYKLSSRIKVLGNVTDSKKINSIYKDCDIGISLITTPTISYQQLDILTAGRCLVAIKNGEIENIFNDDEIYYVNPFYQMMKDELYELINNRLILKKFSDNGRKAVAHFNWNNSLNGIVSFMDDV